MGGVISTIKFLLGFTWYLRSALTPAVQRIRSDPGRPSSNPTKSFWLSHPHPHVSEHQSAALPEEVDVVIIGSGITGTAIAKTLLELPDGKSNNAPLRVAMLDAREACSGATGRNGGHIKEAAYIEYESIKKKYGKDVAAEVIRFRLGHLDALLKVAEAEGEDVVRESQIRRCDTADICFEEEVWEEVKRKLAVFLEDFEDQRGLWVAHEKEEARKLYPFPAAVGAISSPAGSLWPYRLLTPLLSRLLITHPTFTLDTLTPATSITTTPTHYTVSTPRGSIRTTHVIHATNAHASHLLPGLRGLCFPVRGHMSAQRPSPSCSPLDEKGRSYSFFWSEGFDYLTQLPDGMIMFGGGLAQAGNHGFGEVGEASDEEVSLLATAHVGGVMGAVTGVPGWGSVEEVWTGVMGFTPDVMAWVGQVPERVAGRGRPEGGKEWVAAGFCGEGMVNAWGCGVALGRMVLGEEVGKVGLPQPMVMTEQRIKHVDLGELAREWFG